MAKEVPQHDDAERHTEHPRDHIAHAASNCVRARTSPHLGSFVNAAATASRFTAFGFELDALPSVGSRRHTGVVSLRTSVSSVMRAGSAPIAAPRLRDLPQAADSVADDDGHAGAGTDWCRGFATRARRIRFEPIRASTATANRPAVELVRKFRAPSISSGSRRAK